MPNALPFVNRRGWLQLVGMSTVACSNTLATWLDQSLAAEPAGMAEGCLEVATRESDAESERAGSAATAEPRGWLVRFEDADGLHDTLAEFLVDQPDGKLLLLPDGRLTYVEQREFRDIQPLAGPLEPLSHDALAEQLLAELPPGWRSLISEHYVILYNTSDAYARWISGLKERVLKAFYRYWQRLKFPLSPPRFPMVCMLFGTREAYLQNAQAELGRAADAMIGYYSLQTNRVKTFDLTGVEGLIPEGARVPTVSLIQAILQQPQAERSVATIVHEGVHQLAYNSGLQVRLADNPLWVSEGLAMYFESPDPSSDRGWTSIGKVNRFQLNHFLAFLPKRPEDSLVRLISDDNRFRNAAEVADAYAESWALTYFLLRARSRQFVEYLQDLAQLPPLGTSTPRERIERFREHLGKDLTRLDRDFLRYCSNPANFLR
jgi:hypothetical protein